MARVRTHVAAPPERVWDLLRNGHRYAEWVVGTQKIRAVDADFPATDSRLHYTAGVGPVTHDGHTTVLSYVPDERLELEAHAWPLGSARVEIGVRPEGDGSRVELDEHPLRGPALVMRNPVTDAFMWVRGHEMLRRLRVVVERADPPASSARLATTARRRRTRSLTGTWRAATAPTARCRGEAAHRVSARTTRGRRHISAWDGEVPHPIRARRPRSATA